MNRRKFIKISAGATALLNVPSHVFAEEKNTLKKITILHTNDQHSRIEPFDANSGKNANLGGFERRATLINSIRKNEENVLLLDAGDIFQGTPYFNFFGGELEFKLMSKMKYDCATMGNHDFDNGLEGFEKQLKHAEFDFLCSNYDFSKTILAGKTKPYKIIKKNGIKIGIFGIGIELDGLVSKENYKETIYLNPVEKAQEMAKELKVHKKCDLIICLSHLGYEYTLESEKNKPSDIKLAQETENIDLIIGGHTHTFLDEPKILLNKAEKQVIVNQAGWAGIILGRIDFYFNNDKELQHYSYSNRTIDENIV